MAASTLQVVATAVVVLGITIIPFLWGLARLIRHVREHERTEDEDQLV